MRTTSAAISFILTLDTSWLVIDNDGNLYGVASQAGTGSCGTAPTKANDNQYFGIVFKLTP